MCDTVFPKAFFTTRNGSLVWVTKGRKGSFNGVIIKATEKTRRRFPVGTKVVYQNEMGHVMCKGETEEGKECVLHPLDAVKYSFDWDDIKDLRDKVLSKFKDREVLLVTKASPKAVQKKKKVEVRLQFKDLKPGQKYRYTNMGGIHERNSVPIDGTAQTVIRPDGQTGWELPYTEVVLVG